MSDSDSSFKSSAKKWLWTTLGTAATWGAAQLVPFLQPYVTPKAIGGYLTSAWSFVVASSSVPNWFIGLLGLWGLCGIGLILFGIYVRFFDKTQSKPPPWASYTEDTIDGLRWRWRYAGNGFTDPIPYCPHCDYQVDYRMGSSGYGIVNSFYFHCDNCKKDLAGFPDDFDSLVHRTKKKIDLNLRTRFKDTTSPS